MSISICDFACRVASSAALSFRYVAYRFASSSAASRTTAFFYSRFLACSIC